MRSHAKARAAGSTKRTRAGRKPALLLVSLAACVAALVVVVGPASGATTRFLVEVFGSSAQPSFPADRGMAVDQGTEALHVIDSTNDTLTRFNPDGTASNFAALGSNVIDGEGAGDATAHGHLAFESNRQREQVAIDESGEATDGNIYVTQSSQDVIDIFSSEGEYLGQLSESTATGAFGEPCGVAVDSEGTVYVGDRGDDRIHVFEPEALATAPVNADNTASFATVTDPCTLAAGAGATAGFLFVNASTGAQLRKVDAATGEVKYQLATGASTVSVDPTTGHVFVARNTGSSSQVDEYDASGAAEASLVSSFKPGSTVEGIALDSTGEQVYVARSGTENVEVFGPAAVIPDVVTEAPTSNTGTRATLAGTVNPDGVELDECFFEWGVDTSPATYGNIAPCGLTPAEIGAGTTPVAVEAELTGLDPHGDDFGTAGGKYEYRLVAANPNGTTNGSNQTFITPDTVFTEAATGLTPTEATLNGTVNPDTATISECFFEWGPQKEPWESFQKYPETAPCVPGPGGITGEGPVAVEADISGMEFGYVYAYRLRVGYPTKTVVVPNPTVSSPTVVTLQTLGPVIAGAWSEDVVRTEATLKAEINPAGKATTYRFEWGTNGTYGNETEELPVGSDSSTHELTHFLTGLQPGTKYHYRVIATNPDAENVGDDMIFTTYERPAPDTDCPNQAVRYGPSARLPDCRAYEMVSPVEKAGQDLKPPVGVILNRAEAYRRSSLDGGRLTYTSSASFGDSLSSKWSNQYLATRTPSGWSTHGVNLPQGTTIIDPGFGEDEIATFFQAFTPDLSVAWVRDLNEVPLVPTGRTDVAHLYQRDNTDDSLQPLTTVAPLSGAQSYVPSVAGHTADGSRVFAVVDRQLTPDAAANTKYQVYELSSGEPELISVLPGGAADPQYSSIGTGKGLGSDGPRPQRESALDHAVSADGSRVFWTSSQINEGGPGVIYVRINGEVTVPVSESVTSEDSQFWTASTDGSKALFSADVASFFNPAGDLYEFDVDTETSTLIATNAEGVAGAADDLSRVYFVSDESLATGAIAGERNLYLHEEGTVSFVAILAGGNFPDLESYGNTEDSPIGHAARVTPDGSHLVFTTNRSLVGQDNRDAVTGEPVFDVYLFDADADSLSCVSCNPSGARPIGGHPHRAWNYVGSGTAERVAGWIPSWEHSLNELHPMSADGSRVFFNALDALVPHDTNGVQDLYQWEAPGTGTCDVGDVAYSERNGGCIGLVSTGQSPEESEFIDASANGDSVFFVTDSGIDPDDPGLSDIYVARVNGGYPRAPEPIPCVGDSCQSAPAAPNDPSPASAGFKGAGDPAPRRDCGAAARRAAKLSRRAKRLRRTAKRPGSAKRAKQLRRGSRRMAREAKRVSRGAKRCRRNNRRAQR